MWDTPRIHSWSIAHPVNPPVQNRQIAVSLHTRSTTINKTYLVLYLSWFTIKIESLVKGMEFLYHISAISMIQIHTHIHIGHTPLYHTKQRIHFIKIQLIRYNSIDAINAVQWLIWWISELTHSRKTINKSIGDTADLQFMYHIIGCRVPRCYNSASKLDVSNVRIKLVLLC